MIKRCNKVCVCFSKNIPLLARLIFGEARDEPFKGQAAVAWTILNRAEHKYGGYQKTINDVIKQENQYGTMSNTADDELFKTAEVEKTKQYVIAMEIATLILCGRYIPDPTGTLYKSFIDAKVLHFYNNNKIQDDVSP